MVTAVVCEAYRFHGPRQCGVSQAQGLIERVHKLTHERRITDILTY
jgi:hypothetical protein